MNALQIHSKTVKDRRLVYLDYAATSPPDARVVEAMQPYMTTIFGNPSSVHNMGRRARHAVEESREQIAATLGVDASEIVFTGSGTEADNMALMTMLEGSGSDSPASYKQASDARTTDFRPSDSRASTSPVTGSELPDCLITSGAEHEAVLRTARYIASRGRAVSILSPDDGGTVSVESVEGALSTNRSLVSLMHVNNETGGLNDIPAIASRVHAHGGIIHTDAVQSAAFYDLQHLAAAVDMMSLSAHKVGGPKAVGLLYVKAGRPVGRILHGGSQERRRRAGTENVPGIVGFAAALSLAQRVAVDAAVETRLKRDRLASELGERLGRRFLRTTPETVERSCPHILHGLFVDEAGRGLDGEMLILGLDMEGVCVSSGAACSSGAMEPSHVMTAMQINPAVARSAVRFSLGTQTTHEDIRLAAERVEMVVNRVSAGA